VKADDIKALVERLQKYCGTLAPPIARGLTYEAHRALTVLLEENTRLRLEFRADCEKQAEELFAVQRDAARYRWLRDEANGRADLARAPMVLMTNDDCSNRGWQDVLQGADLDAAIDVVRPQTKEKPHG
jgi:hypothetical protein